MRCNNPKLEDVQLSQSWVSFTFTTPNSELTARSSQLAAPSSQLTAQIVNSGRKKSRQQSATARVDPMMRFSK